MGKIIKKLFKDKVLGVTVLVLANVIFATICYFASQTATQQNVIREVSGLTYNNTTDAPKAVLHNAPYFYHTFTLQFSADFFPKDDQYPNIFQTGDEPKTLRLELIHPKTLQVVIGYKDDPLQKVYPVSQNIKMNQWNHVTLSYDSHQELVITLNNKKVLALTDNKFDPSLNDFVLGAGFDKQRTFTGMIKNAHFHVVFKEANGLFYLLGSLWHYYFIPILFQLLFVGFLFLENKELQIKEKEYRSTFLTFLLTFAVIALCVLLSGMVASPLVGSAKWIPYLCLMIPSFLFGLRFIKLENYSNKYSFLIAGLIAAGVVLAVMMTYDRLAWLGVSGILIIFCFLASIPLLKYFSLLSAGLFVFLFSINAVVFITNYGSQNYLWTTIVTGIVIFSSLFSLIKQHPSRFWNTVNKISLILLFIVSVFLSLRSDALFLGSSEFHWGYYTGVIQTVRDGGELLWSAPSQYGFLNLLIPSWLPWTASNSLFFFQAFFFVITTGIIIGILYKNFKNSQVFIFLALIALSLFYFADPTLIGPTLFPSSSVLRFFWCYFLLFAILLEYFRNRLLTKNTKWVITLGYAFGTLWSAESLFYCTAIYGTYLIASVIAFIHSKNKTFLPFLFKNLCVVLVFEVLTFLLYVLVTHHLPDISMYFMYAFSYAGGYGETPIPPWGIHWAIIATLAGIVVVITSLYRLKRYNEWIVSAVCFITLWIISSYYTGRAVTNNVTAMLPIIFFIFVVLISVLTDAKLFIYKLLLIAIFLPWITVGIIGGIGNPQFITTAQHFKFAENIDSKSFQPDHDLGTIIASLRKYKNVRIVYYGDPYNNPVIPEKGGYSDLLTGLPIPMTLLETPIPEQKRNIIVQRFLDAVHTPVYLIHKKNEPLTKFTDWESFLETDYRMKKIPVKSKTYELFVISKKT